MADDVFDVLAEKLQSIPDEIADIYKETTIKAINEAGEKLEVNLKRGAGSEGGLAKHLLPAKKTLSKFSYTYEVDWSHDLIKPNYKPAKERKRKAGKRDYRIAPATWHDLAYIVNSGVRSDEDGHTIRPPTYFIKKAWRNAQRWKLKREVYFNAKLDEYGNKFDDFKTYK